MSIALHGHRAAQRSGRLASRRPGIGRLAKTWQKPWTGTLPETSVYAMLFLWIGSEHNFTVAGVIATALAVFFCFLPR